MTFTKPPRQSLKTTWPNKAAMPTMYDLPSEDPEEPGLPDEFHDFQPELLSETFRLQDYASDNIFTAADLNLYYDPTHANWYKRPDWFAAIGISRFYRGEGIESKLLKSGDLRLSYVIWQEEVSPFVVVELISPGTENEDFGRSVRQPGKPPTKWSVYEEILQIPYYVIYDRYTDRLNGFHLTDGRYQPIPIGSENKIWIPEINAGLGMWQGRFKRSTRNWLRWYDSSGNWLLTLEEENEQRAQQAQREAQQAQRETQQAQRETQQVQQENERLRAKLKALGVDINTLTGSDEQE
ncbi:MAG: Uma2 family endonuclease [Phormidesmis sp.]